jgi:hypothetical protein
MGSGCSRSRPSPYPRHLDQLSMATETVFEDRLPPPPPPKYIKTYSQCIVCQDALSSVVLDPCGHFCLCDSCLQQVVGRNAKCPVCRKTIVKSLQVFIPGDGDENPTENKSMQTSFPYFCDKIVDFTQTI